MVPHMSHLTKNEKCENTVWKLIKKNLFSLKLVFQENCLHDEEKCDAIKRKKKYMGGIYYVSVHL